MAKILITGGAGFIGSQLGYSLHQEGHDITLLDNMSYGHIDNLIINGKTFGNFVEMDIRSEKLYGVMKGFDYVYHFAGIAPLPDCQINPKEAIDVNVAGTANVLDAARFNGIKKVIFSSTAAVYENNKKFPCTENDEISPYLIYATSKQQAELLCNSFRINYGLDITIFRFFNVYGPHQDLKRKHPPLIGYIINELFYDRTPILHSDGYQKRDYVYIDDVVSLCKLVLDKESNSIYNVASGKVYSVRDIFDIISRLLPSNKKPEYEESVNFWHKYPKLYEGKLALKKEILDKEVNKFSLGSNEKAKLLGWEPKYSLETGLFNSVNYALKILNQ